MKLRISLFATLLAPVAVAPATAQTVETLRTVPATLNPEKSYIFFRTNRFKTGIMTVVPVLMRIPAKDEITAYLSAKEAAFKADLPKLQKKYEKDKGRSPQPSIANYGFAYEGATNLYSLKGGASFDDNGPFRAYLVEAPPGIYLIYGVSRDRLNIDTCFCLGTVSFETQAGQIVDLGTLLMDKTHERSDVPELADESGFGSPPNGAGAALGLAIRRGGDADFKPAALARFDLIPAQYRAVGPYLDSGALSINRLAPYPGVLAYRRGIVLDVKSGTELRSGEVPR